MRILRPHIRGETRRGRPDAGYVTVLVLTVAGLLAALVSATLHVARPSLGQAIVNTDELKADGLIEGGMAAAGYALFAARKPMKDVNGKVLPFETGAIRLSVKSEAGRVDLNGSHPKLLAALYVMAGGRAMAPPAFAARILDWRDRDDKPRPGGGAEAEEYRAFGLDYGPRNAPFQSVADLRFLPGMTEEEASLLEPYITVFNPDGLLDPASAPPNVLATVPLMTPAEATSIAEAAKDPETKLQDLKKLIQPYEPYLTVKPPDVYRVRVEARLKNGFTKSAEAVLIPGGRRAPFRTLYWRDIPGVLVEPDSTPATGAT
jgi:general secretion pathway protein K